MFHQPDEAGALTRELENEGARPATSARFIYAVLQDTVLKRQNEGVQRSVTAKFQGKVFVPDTLYDKVENEVDVDNGGITNERAFAYNGQGMRREAHAEILQCDDTPMRK
jgi:hypothetical protein